MPASPCARPGCGNVTYDTYCWRHIGREEASANSSRLAPPPVTAVYGETPVDPETAADFVEGVEVADRAALDRLEGIGLAVALDAAEDRGLGLAELLDDHELRWLHRVAFGEIYTWAGTYRRRGMSIGVDPEQVPTAVRDLLADAAAWCEFGTYTPPEIAVRLHASLVRIHPFVNGNGRVSRVHSELVLDALDPTVKFGWSARSIPNFETRRARYIAALRHADGTDDVEPLLDFARMP